MRLTDVQRLILFSLGQFYQSINQPLVAKPLKLRTSKIAFIELLLESKLLGKQKRAMYKNLESIEKKKLIAYDEKMIRFTVLGLKELEKINQEIKQFVEIENFFKTSQQPRRKLQTMIR